MIINPLDTRKILFYDWDDTCIGSLIVPKVWKDLRQVVNFFVAVNMVHPAIRDADPASIERTDSYRGKYPHMGPMPDGTTEGTVEDGGDYPLTNKLDYTFFKRRMVRMTDVEGYQERFEVFLCPNCGDLSIVRLDNKPKTYPPSHYCKNPVTGKYDNYLFEKIPPADWTDEHHQAVDELATRCFKEDKVDWSANPRPPINDRWDIERRTKRAQAKKDWPRRKIYVEESWYYVVAGGKLELRHGIRYLPGKYIQYGYSNRKGFRPGGGW